MLKRSFFNEYAILFFAVKAPTTVMQLVLESHCQYFDDFVWLVAKDLEITIMIAQSFAYIQTAVRQLHSKLTSIVAC